MSKRNNTFKKFFGVPLSKGITKTDDGKVFVTGKFTTDEVDELGDTITRGATERAIPAYRQWGNIRYMHLPRPVGKVIRIGESDGLDWNEVEIKVVEAEAAQQVEEGLLPALSVGILVQWDDIEWDEVSGGLIINDYTLAEISLVDHPANYGAKLDLTIPDGFRKKVAEVGLFEARKAFGLLEQEETVIEEEKVNTQPAALEKSPSCRQEGETIDDCVSRKIPEILEENPDMDNDQATAIAYSLCEEKCAEEAEEETIEEDITVPDTIENTIEEEVLGEANTTEEEVAAEEETVLEEAALESEDAFSITDTEDLDTQEEEPIEVTTESEEETPALPELDLVIDEVSRKLLNLFAPVLEKLDALAETGLEDSTEGVEESETDPEDSTEEALLTRVQQLEEKVNELMEIINNLGKPANRTAAVRSLEVEETEEELEESSEEPEAPIEITNLRDGLRAHFSSRKMYKEE